LDFPASETVRNQFLSLVLDYSRKKQAKTEGILDLCRKGVWKNGEISVNKIEELGPVQSVSGLKQIIPAWMDGL
jgi:hypothetical protein